MLCYFLPYSKMNQPYIYTYPLPFEFSSHSRHHSTLSRVPCAIQQVLISYLFYADYQQCIYVNPNLPIPPTPSLSPLASIHLFSMSVPIAVSLIFCGTYHIVPFIRGHGVCFLPFSSVQSLSHVRIFATHESQHAWPPCPSPSPGVHSNSRRSSR